MRVIGCATSPQVLFGTSGGWKLSGNRLEEEEEEKFISVGLRGKRPLKLTVAMYWAAYFIRMVYANGADTSFPTPMEEPKKIVRCHYLGTTVVHRPTGYLTVFFLRFYFAAGGVHSIAIGVSYVICLSVCLSACLSQKPLHVQTSHKIFCTCYLWRRLGLILWRQCGVLCT